MCLDGVNHYRVIFFLLTADEAFETREGRHPRDDGEAFTGGTASAIEHGDRYRSGGANEIPFRIF